MRISLCRKCVYPSNARPTISFDSLGVCSGCRYNENRYKGLIDWDERLENLYNLLLDYSKIAKSNGANYDCIIPVSGGKDSHFQVWLIKEKFGFNPLLVHFNHTFNTPAGLLNLQNLKNISNCDLIIRGLDPKVAKIIARHTTLNIGDITWHYHAGIMTVPFQIAIEMKIPLIVWGEHGYGELTGVVSILDTPEFTNWKRKQYDMRGLDPETMESELNLTSNALANLKFPTRNEISELGVRGIYLSNYIKWDALDHAKFVFKNYGFNGVKFKRERTFNLYSKIEDHANDVHDYMKYLKFGYGRATDDASMELRHNRISRKKALELVREYDSKEPKSLEYYLDYLEITKKEFFESFASLRDLNVWEFKNNWRIKYEVDRMRDENIKDPVIYDEIFNEENRDFYYNEHNPPKMSHSEDLNFEAPTPLIGALE